MKNPRKLKGMLEEADFEKAKESISTVKEETVKSLEIDVSRTMPHGAPRMQIKKQAEDLLKATDGSKSKGVYGLYLRLSWPL